MRFVTYVPIFFTLIFILASPISLEKENKKRETKGKLPLTEEVFQRKIRNVRIIACVILAVSVLVSELAPILVQS